MPPFHRFYRSGQIIALEVSTLPICLRDVIGNRDEMQQHGHRIFKTLIQLYMKTKETSYVMRGFQPASIFISEDGTQAQFTDLLSITEEGGQPREGVRFRHPYSCLEEFSDAKWS